jgi:hypothetical protein
MHTVSESMVSAKKPDVYLRHGICPRNPVVDVHYRIMDLAIHVCAWKM